MTIKSDWGIGAARGDRHIPFRNYSVCLNLRNQRENFSFWKSSRLFFWIFYVWIFDASSRADELGSVRIDPREGKCRSELFRRSERSRRWSPREWFSSVPWPHAVFRAKNPSSMPVIFRWHQACLRSEWKCDLPWNDFPFLVPNQTIRTIFGEKSARWIMEFFIFNIHGMPIGERE